MPKSSPQGEKLLSFGMSPESIFWKKVIYRCMRTVLGVPSAKGGMSKKCYGYLAYKEKGDK